MNIMRTSYAVELLSNTPHPIRIVSTKIAIRLKAKKCNQNFLSALIINISMPPSVRPTTSNKLNKPSTKHVFQSSELIKVRGRVRSTPGNTEKDRKSRAYWLPSIGTPLWKPISKCKFAKEDCITGMWVCQLLASIFLHLLSTFRLCHHH